jgi:D-alanyl-D-alanine dipeptidase
LEGLRRPIPRDFPSIEGWQDVPLENRHPFDLVPLGMFAPEFSDIATSAIYYGQFTDSPYPTGELQGSMPALFLRRGIAERLRAAQKLLPGDERLIVYDGWRSREVQKALYDHFEQTLLKMHPTIRREGVPEYIAQYVSLPSTDDSRPSPHSAGSVDVAIIKLEGHAATDLHAVEQLMAKERPVERLWEVLEMDKLKALPNPFAVPDGPLASERRWLNYQEARQGIINQSGRLLNFGTPFDYGDNEAWTNFFESMGRGAPTQEISEIQDNRRKLYNLMRFVGMVSRRTEWWDYYAPESQTGAKALGLNHATYGRAELSDENRRFNAACVDYDTHEPFRLTNLARAAVIEPIAPPEAQ